MNPLTFIGQPIPFKNITYVYPPKLKEVLSNPFFGQFNQIMTTSQEDIWDLIKDKTTEDGTPVQPVTPFEMLMLKASANNKLRQSTMDAFKFFTHEEVRIIPDERIILFTGNIENIKQIEDLKILKEDNFFDFQNIIRQSLGEKSIEPPAVDEDPRVARIKAKARERERIKKKHGTKNGVSMTTSLASLCCMGIGLSPLNIGEISYASVHILIKTYQEQEKYRNDVRFLAGGADPKKLKPKYWIRDLKN